jgi:hypothetical protein
MGLAVASSRRDAKKLLAKTILRLNRERFTIYLELCTVYKPLTAVSARGILVETSTSKPSIVCPNVSIGKNNKRVTGSEASQWNRTVRYAVSAGNGGAKNSPNIQKISCALVGHHFTVFSLRCNICADIEPTTDESNSTISKITVAHTVEASVRRYIRSFEGPQRLDISFPFLSFPTYLEQMS